MQQSSGGQPPPSGGPKGQTRKSSAGSPATQLTLAEGNLKPGQPRAPALKPPGKSYSAQEIERRRVLLQSLSQFAREAERHLNLVNSGKSSELKEWPEHYVEE